ncbi:MAG: dihydrofolate reductase family protein [Mariprofundales bacterium]
MSETRLIPLFPTPNKQQPLHGSYLNLGLQHGNGDAPLIYSNFISSVDGRIAVAGSDGAMEVPTAITNPHDWRLYQELAAQSSVMITSARYFRQLAVGKAQALLPVDGDDLLTWRSAHKMTAQPDLLILSQSLDIPPQALRPFAGRSITVLTGANPSQQHKQPLLDAGVQVVNTPHARVTGCDIRQWLVAHQHLSGYAIAGCGVLHSLLVAGVLDRLFLTTHHTLLGGNQFDTLLRDTLPNPIHLHLNALYYDVENMQTFADYTLGATHDH